MLFFQQKMSFFISCSSCLSPLFLLSFAGLSPTFSFSLSFSFSIFQLCEHDNCTKLTTLDNTDTETISAFRFRLYWAVSSSQDAGGYSISRKNNLELHLGLPFAIFVDWVILHWYACGSYGRAVGRKVTWLPKFLGYIDCHILLGMRLRSRARWAPL